MAGRFDLMPLVGGVLDGLKNRKEGEDVDEQPDWRARLVLAGIPTLGAALVVVFQIELAHADQLLAGAALLTASLLAGFTQIAVWRERLLARINDVNAVQIRALNEAAAHVLACLIAALASVVFVVVLTNLDSFILPSWLISPRALSAGVRHWSGVGVSALATAAFAYLVVSLIIVVNLLWDAYRDEQDRARQEAAKDLDGQ